MWPGGLYVSRLCPTSFLSSCTALSDLVRSLPILVRNIYECYSPPPVILLCKTETYYINNIVEGFSVLYKHLKCYTLYRKKIPHLFCISTCILQTHTYPDISCLLIFRRATKSRTKKNFISIKSTYSVINTRIPSQHPACLIHLSVSATVGQRRGCKMSEA